MYRFVLILICFFLSCQPLDLPTETKKTDSKETNTQGPMLLEPGKVKEIQFLKGQMAHQVFQLPELMEGQYYIINLVALNYEGEELLRPARDDSSGFHLSYALNTNDSNIPYMFETYRNQQKQDCAYIAFKAYQYSDAYFSMFYKFSNNSRDTNALIEVSLNILRIEAHPPTLPDPIKPDDSYTGLFTEKNYEQSDIFHLTGFEDNSWYKLIVKADFTNSIFPDLLDRNFSSSISYGYQNIIFTNSDTHIYYFKPHTNSNPCSIRINGHIGVSYTLSLLRVSNSITEDLYEPDNGPLSPNIERLTGPVAQSLPHSFTNYKESDWIQFTPAEWGVYHLDITITDCFTEPGLKLESSPSIDLEIIQPDGATIELSDNQYLPIGEEMPVTIRNIGNWTITPDKLSPWYIHLRYKSYGENPLPLNYSIRIHSETES